jgi:hypothetical protein
MRRKLTSTATAFLVAALGCAELPGTRESQGAVIGGALGTAAGAAVHEDNRLLGALIGGALGAGGGYLVGARTDWFEDPERESHARDAIRDAQASPATIEDVRRSATADLDSDGFVTIDELTAMERAGLDDGAILDRLRATGQIFDLSSSQEQALRDAGLSERVIAEMQQINRQRRDQILGRG